MKSFLNAKANWGAIYTCFCITVDLGKVRVIRPKLPKSWLSVLRRSSKVLNSTFQMKPYSNVKFICRFGFTSFSIFGKLQQVGEIGPKMSPIIAPIDRKLFILLNCSFHIIWRSIYTFFLFIYSIGASSQNLAQLPQIMGRDTQKVIQSVKFSISHQMKSYSMVKTVWMFSYTCFSIFGELGQIKYIGPKYATLWTPIHRKSFKVFNIVTYIKWCLTQR